MSADLADIQDTFKSSLFKVACQDVARVVSILSIESEDFQFQNQSLSKKIANKGIFFGRFFYLVFFKGFTPTIFDMIPYRLWQGLTIGIYLYRLAILPTYLRMTGYGKYSSWTVPTLGSAQPSKDNAISKPYQTKESISKESRLAQHNFGDKDFESLCTALQKKGAHLSPHSQSPGHPFIAGFPGNFFDHLLGVFKILVAWGQPQYIARAGMFHSLYGTFDYRASFFDLREGRDPLRAIVGPASEEIAFLICTSDRIGLMNDLMTTLYGKSAKSILGGGIVKEGDGNPYPPRLNVQLSSEGFPLKNHITQVKHIIPADLFAQFVIVMIADFMEQGALGLGSDDADICLFQFLRYRFYSDLLIFVSPYLRVIPNVWSKYMMTNTFVEPLRNEVISMKRIWSSKIVPILGKQSVNMNANAVTKGINPNSLIVLTKADIDMMIHMSTVYPYLVEPRLAVACALVHGEKIQVLSTLKFIIYCLILSRFLIFLSFLLL